MAIRGPGRLTSPPPNPWKTKLVWVLVIPPNYRIAQTDVTALRGDNSPTFPRVDGRNPCPSRRKPNELTETYTPGRGNVWPLTASTALRSGTLTAEKRYGTMYVLYSGL